MSHYLNPLFDHVIRLDADEYNNPKEVITDYLDEYSLSRFRATLWDIVETCLTDEDFDDRSKRSDLLFFYQETERMMEALTLVMARLRPFKPSTGSMPDDHQAA